MLEGRGKEALSRILDGLVAYTGNHFAFEESIMRQRGYSALAEH